MKAEWLMVKKMVMEFISTEMVTSIGGNGKVTKSKERVNLFTEMKTVILDSL